MSVIGGVKPPVLPVPLTVALGGTGSTTATGAGSGYVALQATTPGTAQTGNINVSGTALAGTTQATTVIATNALQVNGSGLDTNGDATLNIGNNGNASAILIGSAGQTTTVASPFVCAVAAPAPVATTGTNASQTISITSQAGGASNGGATNNTGGTGSNDAWTCGAGGVASGAATGTNTGGVGGSCTLSSGAGGGASGATTANVGGAAGAFNITGNNGGNGTQTGGAGATVTITAGNAGTGGNAAAGNITITPGTATGSGKAGSVTLGKVVAANGGGTRNQSSRNIIANKPTAPVDIAGGLTASVTQLLEAGIFLCSASASLTLPTAQGSTGIVQALPGTPAIGDIIEFQQTANSAQTATLVAGTGSTINGVATIAAGSRIWRGRITSVAGGSETIQWY